MHWKIRDQILPLDRTLVMGILNLTPDSFSDGGLYFEKQKALDQAEKMIRDGADILDLGAESSRPGAQPVSLSEELDRLLPVLEELVKFSTVPISIDTVKPDVARACLEKGAHILNDVSGLRISGPRMAELAVQYGAGLILMHSRGTPQTMRELSEYQNVIREVSAELSESVERALASGVGRDQLVIDPGLGFAKHPSDNFLILRHLDSFLELGYPLLSGPSRKSFIGQVTGRLADERDFGTAAACAVSVMKGAHIVRVHNVRAMRDVIYTTQAICGPASNTIKGENYVRA